MDYQGWIVAAYGLIITILDVGTTYWLFKIVKNLDARVKDAVVKCVSDKETMKAIITPAIGSLKELMLDQEFMMSVSKTVFENLKAGIYGLLGVDKKQEKSLGAALAADLQSSTPIGALMDMLPENSKFAAKLKEHPELLSVGMKLLAQYLPLAQGQSSIPQGAPIVYTGV